MVRLWSDPIAVGPAPPGGEKASLFEGFGVGPTTITPWKPNKGRIFPMRGYIAVVSRQNDETYCAEVVGIAGCECQAATVDEALHGAKETLRRLAESGRDLPEPRPSHDMISEVSRRSAVAGACLRGLRAA